VDDNSVEKVADDRGVNNSDVESRVYVPGIHHLSHNILIYNNYSVWQEVMVNGMALMKNAKGSTFSHANPYKPLRISRD
jgi:hypothetical protein